MNTLSIDTSDTKKAKVWIKCDSKTFKVSDSRKTRADITLSLIEKVLIKSNLKISEIDKLYVNEGPGSFTGLRVGVSIANALSFAIGRPINRQILGKIISPVYIRPAESSKNRDFSSRAHVNFRSSSVQAGEVH